MRQSLEYWQLYAALLDVHNQGKFEDAIERLTPISKGTSEYQAQAMALLDYKVSSFEMRNLVVAFDIEPYAAIPTTCMNNTNLV